MTNYVGCEHNIDRKLVYPEKIESGGRLNDENVILRCSHKNCFDIILKLTHFQKK